MLVNKLRSAKSGITASTLEMEWDENDDYMEMSPEEAKTLFDNGAVLLIINLPVGSIFGIDMKIYQVAENFRGIKMIPPGIHFIHYSAVSRDESVAPRTGFFHYFQKQEILIKKWDNSDEVLKSTEPSKEELQRIRDNLYDLDRCLGAYPYQNLKQWNRLICNISESLMKKLEPLSGVVTSVTQLMPLNYPPKETNEPSTSSKKFQTLEDKFLPEMKNAPGTEIRFTEIPKLKYPEGSTAAEITMHNMDSTYILEQLLKTYDNEQEILGELQMAHICFLIGHVYEAFDHWKKLVHTLCSVDSGLQKYSNILTTFLTILHYQLKEIPTDFFVDITANNNFLQVTLQTFFENVKCSDADEKFKKFVNKFQKNLTDIYKWDFESVPDEDLPVVVEL